MTEPRSPSEDGADGLSGDNDPRNQGKVPTQAELDADRAANPSTEPQVSPFDPMSQAG